MDIHYSSKSNEWETPLEIYEALNREFHFTLDPCATKSNAKCDIYFDIQADGLHQDWSQHRVFMNPPYGRQIGFWVKKAYEESTRGALVVCLIPSRTDTRWWHEYCMNGEIRFFRGRLKFGGSKNSAPFPSAVVIFNPTHNQQFNKDGRKYAAC
jgi:phage N-6-adenine-methyltransferase